MSLQRLEVACLALAGFLLPASAGWGDEPGSLVLERSQAMPLEQVLIQSLMDVRDGRLDEALGKISGLTQRYVEEPAEELVPANFLKVPDDAQSVLLVDMELYRLYLFQNDHGTLRRADDYYVSIGKGGGRKALEGDAKTPVGVYAVVSFLPGNKLPDMYGPGAFPLDYPNRWDRLHGRTGSGIWIHGTESARYSRPPLSSLGCVTLASSDFLELQDQVAVSKTPVVVTDRVEWTTQKELGRRLRSIETVVEEWRLAWESLDTERYLGYYAADFRAETMDRARFAAHKRRVNATKNFIEVELEDISIFAYPGEVDLVQLKFVQRYTSDSFSGERRKQQFWQRGSEGWKIVYEGDA